MLSPNGQYNIIHLIHQHLNASQPVSWDFSVQNQIWTRSKWIFSLRQCALEEVYKGVYEQVQEQIFKGVNFLFMSSRRHFSPWPPLIFDCIGMTAMWIRFPARFLSTKLYWFLILNRLLIGLNFYSLYVRRSRLIKNKTFFTSILWSNVTLSTYRRLIFYLLGGAFFSSPCLYVVYQSHMYAMRLSWKKCWSIRIEEMFFSRRIE